MSFLILPWPPRDAARLLQLHELPTAARLWPRPPHDSPAWLQNPGQGHDGCSTMCFLDSGLEPGICYSLRLDELRPAWCILLARSRMLWSGERNSHPVGSAPHENQRWRTGGDSRSAETNFQHSIQLFKASLELDSPKPCLVPQSPLEEGRRGEPPPAAPSGWALPSPSQNILQPFSLTGLDITSSLGYTTSIYSTLI